MTTERDRYYIGGANAAGILGCSPYRTPLGEWLQITGQAEAPTAERESFFRRRRAFEPIAAELFRERTGLDLVAVNQRYDDSQLPFIRAEIDAETTDGANVEIKTVHPFAAREWGEEGADDCPVHVTAQAMHGLMVRGRDLCYVLAMIGFDDIRVYRIERDDETIAAMRAREAHFWQEHVLPLRPPPPANAADVARLFARDLGTAVVADTAALLAVAELHELRAEIAAREAAAESLREQLQLAMGGAARLLGPGGRELATWRTQSAACLDQRALREAMPDVFARFVAPRESRPFRLKAPAAARRRTTAPA